MWQVDCPLCGGECHSCPIPLSHCHFLCTMIIMEALAVNLQFPQSYLHYMLMQDETFYVDKLLRVNWCLQFTQGQDHHIPTLVSWINIPIVITWKYPRICFSKQLLGTGWCLWHRPYSWHSSMVQFTAHQKLKILNFLPMLSVLRIVICQYPSFILHYPCFSQHARIPGPLISHNPSSFKFFGCKIPNCKEFFETWVAFVCLLGRPPLG